MNALIQGTQEWLDLRKNKVTATDAPILMGVSPWSTPYKRWCEKLSLVPEKEMTEAMQRGLDMEEEARADFERQTKIVVFPEVILSDKYDFMMASLDGIDIEHKNAVEIKCPGEEDHRMALDGVVPEKYYPQLQHQMVVTNLDMIYYFSYRGKSSKIIQVGKDEEYIQKMLPKEREFYRCMQEFEAPNLCDRDFLTRDDDIWVCTVQKWKDINEKLKELESEQEELKDALIIMSAGKNTKGGGITLSKIYRKGNIDYKDIPELKELNLEKYRKPSTEMWRLNKCRG